VTAPAVDLPRGKSNGRAPIVEPPAAAAAVLELIPVDLVDVGENVRIQPGELDELVESIKAHGVLQPVRAIGPGEDGRYRLVWGQRRLLASRLAGLERIPAIVEASADVDRPGAARAIEQLVENLQRADLNPIDEAKALRDVLDADKELTQDALAQKLGRSAPWVSNSLRLLEVEPKVQSMIVGGQLTAAHVKALAGLAPKTQIEVANEAVGRGMSAHATEEWVRRVKDQEVWRKKNEAEQRKEAEARRAATARRVEEAAKKIPKDAPVHVGGGYYGNASSVASIVKLFQEAGFSKVVAAKDTLQSRPKGKVCDCVAWKVEIGWSGGLTIAPACVVKKHTDAAYNSKLDAERQHRELQDRIRAAAQEHVRVTALGLAAANPLAVRILLWTSMDWSLNDWVSAHKGDRKRADAWDEISALSVNELATEFAKFVHRAFGDRYNVKLDWPRIATELGLDSAEAAS
jgi:ParB family chromosome partitioning protein